MPRLKSFATSVAAKHFSYEYGHATAIFSHRKQPLSEDLGQHVNKAVVVGLSSCYLPAMQPLNLYAYVEICRQHSISYGYSSDQPTLMSATSSAQKLDASHLRQ